MTPLTRRLCCLGVVCLSTGLSLGAHGNEPPAISLGTSDRIALEARVFTLGQMARERRPLPANTSEALADALRTIALHHDRRLSTSTVVLPLFEPATSSYLLESIGPGALATVWQLGLLALGRASSGGTKLRDRLRAICRFDPPWAATVKDPKSAREWLLHCTEARRLHEDASYVSELGTLIAASPYSGVPEAASCALLDVVKPSTPLLQLDQIVLRQPVTREVAAGLLGAYSIITRGRAHPRADQLRRSLDLSPRSRPPPRCCSNDRSSPPSLFVCP